MKLPAIPSPRPHQSQCGSVVLILLAFLVLMTMLCTATWRQVYLTRQEVSLIEKHQVERLARTTNAPPVSAKSQSTP